MKVKCWITVSANGELTIRKTQPYQENGHVCVPLLLEIADEAFHPPKMPVVEITIDAAAVPKLTVVQEAMEALQEAGIKVKIVEGAVVG
jgi:hypothetical protein